MKKKLLLLLLIGVSCCTSTVFAASEKASIAFRDIPWNTTKADVEKALFEEGATEHGMLGDPNTIYRMGGIDYTNVTSGKDRVEGGGYRGWYAGVSLAGYEVEDTYACYIYPIENGNIVRSDDDAELYFGWYVFGKEDYSDHRAIYDDLNEKLTSLYGEGENYSDDYKETITWYDSSNNQIRLLLGGKNDDYITLGYMSSDANARLDEMQAALDAEAATSEATEMEANKSNVSGL